MNNTKSKMSLKHLLSAVGFLLCFAIAFVALDRCFFDETRGSTVWESVQREDGPEILFMGNSHAHCSFIPDIFDSALGVDTAVLTSFGQPMYMTTENLKTVLHYYTPELIILEANAIHADNREEIRGERKASSIQNIDGILSPAHRLRTAVRTLKLEDIPLGFSQLCRKDLMYSRWKRLGEGLPENRFQRQDVQGYQFLSTYFAGEEDVEDIESYYMAAEGQSFTQARILEPLNEKALHEFLRLAEKHGIEVWIVKSPTLRKDKDMLSTMARIEEITAEHSAVTRVIDLHEHMTAMGLTPSDFYDRGHLNRQGAVKCTTYLSDILGERLGREPTYSDVFFYQGESIEEVGDGLYRYTMEAFGDTQYYIEQNVNGTYVCLSDWGPQNTVTIDLPPDQANRLRVSMLPADVPADQCDTEGLVLAFMTRNASS